MKFIMLVLAAALMAATGNGCDNNTQGEDAQNSQQAQLTSQGVASVGVPGIKNFTEKRFVKTILELRDRAVTTYTYTYSQMTGKKVFFCNSVGYPLPGGTQYTNPQSLQRVHSVDGAGNLGSYYDDEVLPQADPNGLYSPSSSQGTYVACVNPKDGKIEAVYSEPDLITSPYPLPTE